MHVINVKSNRRNQFIDITNEVKSVLKEMDAASGICLVFTPHTTAGITINENADPTVQTDMEKGLDALAFNKLNFDHMEGNSDSHIKSTLVGCSEMIIIEDGNPVLGTWQGIYFCEFDGPRNRKVYVQIK